MGKRFLALLIMLIGAATVYAQDMPPLPALPGDQTAATNPSAMPPLPSNTTAQAPAAGPALPALPDQSAQPAAAGAAPAMPPLPDQSTQPAAAAGAAPAMPPLPDQNAQPAASGAAPAMPPLPDQGQVAPPPANNAAAAQPAMPPLPGAPGTAAPAADATQPPPTNTLPAMSTPAVETTPTEAAPAEKKEVAHKWHPPVPQPNVIFGGWVKSKGGNETSRLAWVSQQVLNGLDRKGYKMTKEEGLYPGEKGVQWRRFSFKAPKSKMLVQVYVRQSGKKVWLRVGPDEPPAGQPMSFVHKLRAEDLKALAILKTKLKGRIAPHQYVAVWEANFKRPAETADE